MEQKHVSAEQKLEEINSLHPNLQFTLEREKDKQLPVLDMKILRDQPTGKLSSTWYNKPTDTGLIMNYHALAPKRYKRSVVSGFVHRIHRSCSSWHNFHNSLEKAKRVLEKNQYPPTFYEPIIRQALHDVLKVPSSDQQPVPRSEHSSTIERRPLIIQYRGKCTEEYARALHKIMALCVPYIPAI